MEKPTNFKRFLDDLGIGYFKTRLEDHVIIDHNSSLCKIFGFDEEKNFIGSKTKSFWKDKNERQRLINKLEKSGSVEGYIGYFQDKNGKEKILEVNSYIIQENGTKPKFAEGIFKDITKKYNSLKLVQHSEKKLRTIINNIPDEIILLDMNLKIQYINPTAYDIIGFYPNELIGSTVLTQIHKNDGSKIDEAFNILKSGNRVKSLKVRVQHKRGYYIPVSVNANLIKMNGEEKIVAVVRDISERKAIEKELRESERKFKQILEAIPDLFLLVSSDFVVLDYVGKEYLYLPPKDVLGKELNDILPSDKAKPSMDAIRKTLKTNEIQTNEYELMIQEKKRFFEARHLPISESKVGIFIRDITERKRMEREMKKSQEQYKRAFNETSFYKNLFAHDMNNILQNLKSSIELGNYYLESTDDLENLFELFDIMKEQIFQGTKLISNVNKLSKVEKNKVKLHKLDICKPLKEAINYINESFPTRKVKIDVHYKNSHLFIMGNELIFDIFQNILQNAVKYNDSVVIKIDVKVSEIFIIKKPYVEIQFQDNGIGISDQRKELIFKTGYESYKGGKGLGMGLSLVKKIVQQYNGKIWVEDRIKGQYQKGSNFKVIIPKISSRELLKID
jgi:PAS domain S-box-containing protein